MLSNRALVFGARGTIGSAICHQLEADNVEVLRVSRRDTDENGWLSMATSDWSQKIDRQSISQAIWAQGMNAEGNILDNGVDQIPVLFEANVMFIVRTLRELLAQDVFERPARLVIISSVWQQTARKEKMAYVTTKAALAGLVRSLLADLGPLGISVNAVLPGVVDSPMSRAFLTVDQIGSLEGQTPAGILVTPEEVARVSAWLGSPKSSGVNGQFITVDGGWNEVRNV